MRFFYEENIGHGTMALSDETAKHVAQVLRMKVGDQFVLTDGRGLKALVEIASVGKRDCAVNILCKEQIENENPHIILAISFTKNNARMEWLLEKITEIGIRDIYPLQTARSEKVISNPNRFQKKMVAAMLQSQQYHLPILHESISFEDLIKEDFDNKFIAHCVDEIKKKELYNYQLSTVNSQLVCIGPEGDFTIEEIETSLQQNFKSISLGNNRLRTETAGLVAVTLLHHI